MNTWVPTFLGGIAVGVAVAAPIGPMGLFCIQRTIASGASAGLSIGLAAATVHVAYGVAALAGLGIVAPSWSEGGSWAFSLLSAALLFWFGARALCRKAAVCPGVISAPCGPVRSFGGALLLALTNPLTALLFAAAMPVFAGAELPLSGPPIIAGVFVGSFGWWVALTSVVAALRSRLDSRSLVFANKGAALVLVGLGTVVMTQAIRLAAP